MCSTLHQNPREILRFKVPPPFTVHAEGNHGAYDRRMSPLFTITELTMNISDAIETVDFVLMLVMDGLEIEPSLFSSYDQSTRTVEAHLNVISLQNWEILMEIGFLEDFSFPDPHDQAEGKCIPHGRFKGWGIASLPDFEVLEPSGENLEEGWPF